MTSALSIQTRIATTFQYNISAYLHSYVKNYRSDTNFLRIKWLLYYWRCIFSVVELDARYEWRVMPPPSVLRHITCKAQVIYGHSAYRTTAILLEPLIVLFRLALEIRLESYGPRHALILLWYSIVCVYCKLRLQQIIGLFEYSHKNSVSGYLNNIRYPRPCRYCACASRSNVFREEAWSREEEP